MDEVEPAADELDELPSDSGPTRWDQTFSGNITKVVDGISQDVPFSLRLHSDDVSTGKVTGEMEWRDAGAVNKIEGNLGKGRVTFEETESVSGSAPPGCTYDLSVDTNLGAGMMSGRWDCRATTGDAGSMTLARGDTAPAGSVASADTMPDETTTTTEETTTETTEDTSAGDTQSDASDIASLIGGATSDEPEPAPAKPAKPASAKPAPAKPAKPAPAKPAPAKPAATDKNNAADDILNMIGD